MTSPSSKQPTKKGSSGEHPTVKEFRRKLESLSDHQLTDLQDLNARLDPLVAKENERSKSDSPPAEEADPPSDPRREPPDDPRREASTPPSDVITIFERDPFPAKKG